jgi:taurine dioxygenase
LTPAIGAEILGLDLASPNIADQIPAIRAALLTHKVIFFRDQHISAAQHIAFARHFGDLEIHPATPKDQPNPEILRIAHGPDSRGSENNWHSDVTWRERPSLGSILRAIEVPEVGGDTLFADMHLAFLSLSPEMQRIARSLTAVHDIARVFAKKLGKAPEELHAKYPPQSHPVVRTHPETGAPTLFVNGGFTSHIEGLSPLESERLLAHFYATASNPERQCRTGNHHEGTASPRGAHRSENLQPQKRGCHRRTNPKRNDAKKKLEHFFSLWLSPRLELGVITDHEVGKGTSIIGYRVLECFALIEVTGDQ